MSDLPSLHQPDPSKVQMHWGIKIPLRDGICLHATLYLRVDQAVSAPAIFIMTPYIAQASHDQAVYFASRGYPYLAIDVRGRGNSEGEFRPLINEAQDGFDVVEWLAVQPYCNGQVTMIGGSYSGHCQWATAKEFPPHLATIVPVASPYISIDFPMLGNIPSPYIMQWLILVAGRTSQERVFWSNERFWGTRFRQWFESGQPFQHVDGALGNPSSTFQEWVSHPRLDAYWDRYNPTAEAYSKLSLPILTITGSCDDDQLGALMHYREHLRNASSEARARHYLVIGPWDHSGTRIPQQEFLGIKVGPASLIDLSELHLHWYAWTMQGRPKPEFLKKNVAYYVMGVEQWRYADTLDEITARWMSLYLDSSGNPTDVFRSGSLTFGPPTLSGPDHYVYDPRDVSQAGLESTVHPESRSDQRMIHALNGRQLIYHSAPFEEDIEISGFFKFSTWLAIDQPDTDFRVWVCEVDMSGCSILLTMDQMRARYRQSLREEALIDTRDALRYDFSRFTFISRQVKKGHRLRLVIGPINSIYAQKNYNSGNVVAEESIEDARSVTVSLFHDASRPSVLHVPIGRPEGCDT